ncbi:zinc ABC transporter substrate-binding protein [Propioniciclava sp. MC1683]|uniref:metal ABC transporter substrate-binding protein n=1 Tax=Propioniciclava sp. MC1683 TaxID=2760309 RepID=UPI001600B38B|nr:metal ABC transporter substrate-binding protein [Propioniciclava sp. MC1683]MBB1500037.1 zinc ABC transporter substrate-binding protein [Propioniciclava sp. MC1683]
MRSTILAVPLLLTLAACSPTPAASESASEQTSQTPVAIATTTQLGSILSDITQCAGTTSSTLMGPGDDPHDFSVSSREVADLTKTKLVVANGLNLESGLQAALDGAKADGATIFEVAPLLDPLTYASIEEEQAAQHAGHGHAAEPADGHTDEHAHGEYDPHVHMDVARMAKAAGLIGAELAKVTGDDAYTTCGTQVEQKLQATDAQVREILASIPAEKRVLVTDHEAYNYFAHAYDFEIAGVVIPGGSTDAEPSSAELADLVKVVQEDKVSAIFSNNTVNPRLVEAVAAEAGTDLAVVQLYEGSVGPQGSGAETYADMMLANARLIADALK